MRVLARNLLTVALIAPAPGVAASFTITHCEPIADNPQWHACKWRAEVNEGQHRSGPLLRTRELVLGCAGPQGDARDGAAAFAQWQGPADASASVRIGNARLRLEPTAPGRLSAVAHEGTRLLKAVARAMERPGIGPLEVGPDKGPKVRYRRDPKVGGRLRALLRACDLDG